MSVRDRFGSRDWVVYGLFDPRSGALRYVGKTMQPINRRLYAHRHAALHGKHQYVSRWLKGLLDAGMEPIVKVLDAGHGFVADVDRAEVECIALARAIGAPLTNQTSGGEGAPRRVSDETRAKLRAANLGKKATPEARENMRRAHLGGRNSEASKRKLSERMSGDRHPNAKLSDDDVRAIRARFAAGENGPSINRDFPHVTVQAIYYARDFRKYATT